MVIQAVNFSLWFDALIHESARLFHDGHEKREDIHPRCLSDVSNMSTVVLGCVYGNNTIYQLIDDFVNPTFLPFTIEFTLLAGECFFHWYYHCSVLIDGRRRSLEGLVAEAISGPATSVGNNSGINGQLSFGEDRPNGVERESCSSSDSVSSDLLPLSEGVADNPTRSDYFLFFVSLFVTIGLNVSLVCLSIRQNYARDEDTIRYMKIYLYEVSKSPTVLESERK